MNDIDSHMLQSMATSFRAGLDFSFNNQDMADLLDRCRDALTAQPVAQEPVEAGQQAFALGLKAAEDQVRSMRATDGVLCPRTISLVASGLAIAATKARAQSA